MGIDICDSFLFLFQTELDVLIYDLIASLPQPQDHNEGLCSLFLILGGKYS